MATTAADQNIGNPALGLVAAALLLMLIIFFRYVKKNGKAPTMLQADRQVGNGELVGKVLALAMGTICCSP